jgi:hypothetical protein
MRVMILYACERVMTCCETLNGGHNLFSSKRSLRASHSPYETNNGSIVQLYRLGLMKKSLKQSSMHVFDHREDRPV